MSQSKVIKNASAYTMVSVLPAADIFLATFSSTVLWALLCHIPVILFDFYGLGYNTYDLVDGVESVREKKAFVPSIRKLIQDSEHYTNMVQKQAEAARRIWPFDGKCTERILECILSPPD